MRGRVCRDAKGRGPEGPSFARRCLTWLLSRPSWTTRLLQPAWQGVMYSTRALRSQTGLKSSDGQEQGSAQPGNSSSPGCVLVGEEDSRVSPALLPQAASWGHLGSSPESNGQRSELWLRLLAVGRPCSGAVVSSLQPGRGAGRRLKVIEVS